MWRPLLVGLTFVVVVVVTVAGVSAVAVVGAAAVTEWAKNVPCFRDPFLLLPRP